MAVKSIGNDVFTLGSFVDTHILANDLLMHCRPPEAKEKPSIMAAKSIGNDVFTLGSFVGTHILANDLLMHRRPPETKEKLP